MRIIGNNPAADNAEITAVASGTLPSGQPVIVNADGTVSVAAETAVSQVVGSNAVFESATTTQTCAAYDANSNKVVVVFVDSADSSKGKAVVGTISGTSITFGATATWHANSTNFVDMVYHAASQKVVIVYYDGDNSGYGTSVVGTVSGTTISFGSTVIFNSASTGTCHLAYDSSAEKVVVAYRTTSDVGKAQVGTVSGTNISWGTAANYNAGVTGAAISCAYDINANKTVVAYKDEGNSSYGSAAVGTISGTDISFGSEVVFETATTDNISVGYDSSSQKVVIAYRDRGNSDFGTAIVGTVSGTSISFGTAVVFEAAHTKQSDVTENPAAGFVNIFYVDNADSSKGKFVTATVSGTSLAFSAVTTLTSGSSSGLNGAYDSASEQTAFVYIDSASSSHGTAVVVRNAYTSTNLTAENFIGFSPGSVGIESRTQAVGSETVFEAASSTQFGSTFDTSNNKVVFSYTDAGNSNKGTAIVGTISDTSISFGSAVEFEQGATESHAATFDTNSNKVVLAYRDQGNSNYGTAIVGTVSGTNISFGSAVAFVSSNSDYIGIAFDSSSNKVVISYVDIGDSSKGKAIVGTVSGTNISFGSATAFESGSTQMYENPVFDSSNNKVVIPYKDLGNSNYGTAVVGTVSGTSISFGTPVVFAQGETRDIGIDFDTTNNKVVIAYKNESNSNYGTSIVGTVSGTSISFGTAVVYQSSDSRNNNVTFDPSAQTSTITYKNQASSEVGQFVVGTISGTSISFTSATTFTGSNSAFFLSTTLDSNSNRLATAFYDQSNSNYGTSVILKTAFTTITRDEVASGSNAVINIGSAISTNQLSLTAGQQYFVQTDGTLGLTAADPSVIAGTAISATEIIVKG